MTWIRVVPTEEAEGDLRRVYERVRVSEGSIGQPFDGLTNNAAALYQLIEFTSVVRFGASDLSRLHQEMIATYVSALNGCVF